jgi:hypothetical protein
MNRENELFTNVDHHQNQIFEKSDQLYVIQVRNQLKFSPLVEIPLEAYTSSSS